jgi:hypothetical protein
MDAKGKLQCTCTSNPKPFRRRRPTRLSWPRAGFCGEVRGTRACRIHVSIPARLPQTSSTANSRSFAGLRLRNGMRSLGRSKTKTQRQTWASSTTKYTYIPRIPHQGCLFRTCSGFQAKTLDLEPTVALLPWQAGKYFGIFFVHSPPPHPSRFAVPPCFLRVCTV